MQEIIKHRRKRKSVKKEQAIGILFAMTPLIGFLLFGLIPMFLAVVMSFMKITGYSLDGSYFIGWQNYKEVLNDPIFHSSIGTTFLAAVIMPVTIGLSLVIATLLNKNELGTKVFRVIFFLPFVCSVVAITTMWRWLYDYNFGVFNGIIEFFGGKPVPWIISSKYFMLSMQLMGLWSGTGFGIILYSASLGNVPRSYYEAAKIDGANGLQQFFKITLPCISPTTFFLFTTGLIGALQDFSRFQVMGGDYGGPDRAGLTIVFYLWQKGFTNVITEGMGKASAVSLILAIGIILITRLNFWVSKWWVHND